MNQNLSNWANVAQVVSGAAVVVTLIFLILELRTSTSVTRAAAFQDYMVAQNDFNMALVSDAALSQLWVNRSTPRELTEAERAQLVLMYRTQYRIYEGAYFSWQYGSLSEDQWARFGGFACGNLTISDADVRRRVEGNLSDVFLQYLRQSCDGLAGDSGN